MTKELTLAEREAIIAEQQNEMLKLQLTPLKSALAAIQIPAVQSAVAAAEAALPSLRDHRQQWVANILAVLRDHPAQMAQEVERIQALIAPPAPGQDPA